MISLIAFTSLALLGDAALALPYADRPKAEIITAVSITPAETVQHAYDEVIKHQATLGTAINLREKLLRLEAVDQAGRQVLGQLSINSLPEVQRRTLWDSVWKIINKYDLECQHQLKILMPLNAWFKSSVVGKDGARAAFLIVQHAVNDPPLMRFVAKKMEEYVPEGNASGSSLALITDRIALEFDHKPQTYGSQVECVNGKWMVTNVLDPIGLDYRRKKVGLDTEAEYLKNFNNSECPASTSKIGSAAPVSPNPTK